MLHHLDVSGLDPSGLPRDDFAFLGMHHIVVENTVDLGGVAPRRVGVEDDALALEVFVRQRQPFYFPDGPWTWCSLFCARGRQALQNEAFRASSLDKAQPLFPLHVCFRVGTGSIPNMLVLVKLASSPSTSTHCLRSFRFPRDRAKRERFLLFLDVVLPGECEAIRDVLNQLVTQQVTGGRKAYVLQLHG